MLLFYSPSASSYTYSCSFAHYKCALLLTWPIFALANVSRLGIDRPTICGETYMATIPQHTSLHLSDAQAVIEAMGAEVISHPVYLQPMPSGGVAPGRFYAENWLTCSQASLQ